MHVFQQVGRKRRSHPEEEGQIMTKGSVGQTTPAVAASDRRKSLKLVRRTRSREPGKRPERGLLISCQCTQTTQQF